MKTESIPYRMPIYRGIFHFLASWARIFVHKLFQLGMRDAWNQPLIAGDRVFDLDSYYDADRTHGDPSHYGTIIENPRSISGLSVLWDNQEVTQLIDSSLLLKMNTL